MPLFSPYFSLDSSAFRVGNGGRLRCRMGASGIGIYVMLLSHLRDCRDCRAPLDYDMLAFDLHEDAAAVRRVVEDFGLFDIDRSSGTFTSSVLTTVRGMLSDDGAAAGGGTTRTVRQRRVRSAGETHRRAVHRLATDNALPPAEEEEPAEGDAQFAELDAEPAEVKNEPAEELPTSSENEITPAEGEPQPAELDAPLADEENATGDFAPTSIAAEGEPAEVKHEAADADSTPTEGEREPAEEENVPTAFADARSPRREENRKEQNKKPHTPIVPFPQSGKGTRASHPAAAVVGAQEGSDASAEGDEEPLVGNPLSVPSASAERDAPPCATAPTVLGAPAQTLASHPSPDTANGESSTEKGEMSMPNSQFNTLTASEKPAHPQTLDPHPSPDTAKADTSMPNGQTCAENMETSTNHSQPNALTTSEEPAHPQTLDPHPNPDAENGRTSTEKGEMSAEKMRTSLPNSQPNTLTASEEPAHPNPDTANPKERDTHPSGKMQNGASSVPNGRMSAEKGMPNALTTSEKTTHSNPDTANRRTSVPNSQTDTANSPTSTTDAQPNSLTTSEKADEASRGEEGEVEAFVPPTANEVRRFAETLHHPEFDAEWFVAYYTERHWRRHNGQPVVSWQTTARYWLDHPLRVARHLLDHRPAASPVSVGVGGPSAVVVPAAGNPAAKPVGTSTYPAAGSASSTSPGTYPVGTGSLSPRSSASPVGTGAPHVGSLSLPAPTPLQQSRLSDLKGMVLHLFADAPAAAPASASTAPDLSSAAPDVPHAAADVPASASTPDWVARNSVRPARVLSPAEAAQVIAQQTLAVAEAETVPRVVHDSTDDAEEIIDTQASPTNAAAKGIETQVLSPADAEESVRACHDFTTDAKEEIETQALSPAAAEKSVRACDDSTADTAKGIDAQAFSATDAEEGALNGHDSTTDAAKGIETQVLSPAHAEESVRSCGDSTDEDEEEIGTQAFSIPDTAKGIDIQALSPADAKESVRACDNSTNDAAKGIDAQAFSTTDTEEDALNGHDSTTDNEEEIDTQAFSTAGTEEDIETQALSPADAKEDIRSCDDSTDDAEEGALNGHDSTTDTTKGIDAQAFSTADAKESVRACDNSTNDAAKGIETQAFSADKGRWGVRSPRGPDPPTDDGHDSTDTGNDFADAENHFTAQPSNFSADRHPPAAVGTALAADLPIFAADECRPLHTFTEKHPYLNPSFHEPHPLLRLHPPSFGGFGRTFRVQSAQSPFGRPFLGRFVDIRPACTVGSRPLRPRLALCRTERGRCRPEHPDRECTTSANAIRPPADAPEHTADTVEHGTDERKIADFIDADTVRGHKIDRNEPEHPANAAERSANAFSTPADGHEHDAQRAKNADFIDVDPARGHQTDRNTADGCKRHEHAPEHPANAPERSTNAIRPPEDGHEHNAQRAKNADFIDADPVRRHKTERNESEHLDRGCKRHDLAPEHPADGHQTDRDELEHPAYDPDAGQRVLRSAAHRRAVRAEREACCGALRHLAHCCVAF